MVTDPIADLLTRLRNASRAGHPTASVPVSTMKRDVLKLLQDEGYLDRVEEYDDADGHKQFKVYLRYVQEGKPVIREMKRLSRPGKRVYVSKDEIPNFRGGLGLYVVSTSRGVLSDTTARKEGIGGELLCSVF